MELATFLATKQTGPAMEEIWFGQSKRNESEKAAREAI
jgi:hypothetical protein